VFFGRRREMKLATFESKGRTRAGLVRDGYVFEIPSASSLEQIIGEGRLHELQKIGDGLKRGIEVDKVKLKAPVTSADKILMAAINYRTHGAEQNTPPPKEPYFFTKFRSCIIGNGDPILIPRVSRKVDWEVELAVVIGKKCRYVGRKDALNYVAGYTVANDVSFRDLQFQESWPTRPEMFALNWVKGKALPSALPLGPWLATADEMDDPQNLSLSLKVNGIERQKGSTGDMVFSVSELIGYLSDGLTLLPGDLISTGTPAGVAAFSGAPFLKDGDTVEAAVEGIGSLTNPVKVEANLLPISRASTTRRGLEPPRTRTTRG